MKGTFWIQRLAGYWRYGFGAETKTASVAVNTEPSPKHETRELAARGAADELAAWFRANDSEAAAQDVEAWSRENFPAEPSRVDIALQHCEEIETLAGQVPTEGAEFAASVLDRSTSIKSFIDAQNEVTDDQMEALKNMVEGLQRWVH